MRIVGYPAFLNETNPYNRLLYENVLPLVKKVDEYYPWRVIKGKIDIVHLHWPDLIVTGRNPIKAAFRVSVFLARLLEYKMRGAKIIWTVHNAAPHDATFRPLAACFWPAFLSLVDGLIFMSVTARIDAVALRPSFARIPYAIIPHGHYGPVLGTLSDRMTARQRLNLPPDKYIFLHFGQIRPYKNVPLLMREFLALGRPDTFLVVAGSCSRTELQQELEQLAAGHDNIRLDIRFIPDETLYEYLAASHMVVLPYKRILNSGSALMALSAHRPVIAPKVGSIAEVAEQVGSRWLRAYAGAFDRTCLEAAFDDQPSLGELPDLRAYDWPIIAQQTVDFYRQILGR
ncbi:MAG: glycosyltransferase [Dongiaceae bacterium]